MNFSGCGDVRRGLEWAADLLSASDNECYVNSAGWLRVKAASCGLSVWRQFPARCPQCCVAHQMRRPVASTSMLAGRPVSINLGACPDNELSPTQLAKREKSSSFISKSLQRLLSVLSHMLLRPNLRGYSILGPPPLVSSACNKAPISSHLVCNVTPSRRSDPTGRSSRRWEPR